MILLVTANTMAQSIRERTNELAVLKTLGFGDGRVLSMVLLESCFIAFVGGLAGLAVSRGVLISCGDPTGMAFAGVLFPGPRLSISALRSSCSGSVAGIPAGAQASRLRIVDALRRN